MEWADEIKTLEEDGISWRTRVLYPTLLRGIVGGGIGWKVYSRELMSTYATNLAIVTGCYCGAREFVRVSRHSGPDNLLDSAIAGFGTGAILGRLQGDVLCGHSERLAVGFGLLNTTPGVPIRVTKNLHMCESCHQLLKFISKLVRREISVRDTECYHHFKDGVCSCVDSGYKPKNSP